MGVEHEGSEFETILKGFNTLFSMLVHTVPTRGYSLTQVHVCSSLDLLYSLESPNASIQASY